jgi:hypothetical protein
LAIKLGDLELATPGDVVVGGTAYGVAFAVDAFFFSGGATSAESAGAAAAAALGLKYGIQKALAWRRARKPAADRQTMAEQETDTKNDGSAPAP